jgi:superfamily II DNA or RNA helicase
MPGPLVDPRSLRDAIAREESRLLRLQAELGHAQAHLAELKTTLAAHGKPIETAPSAPSTAAEKVALFRARFRGRDDIYPRFWSNTRTGRKGYAPACGNEWVRGVCEKPRVKCGECPNQAFLPVEDQVILDHLQGRHVVGVYPLLADETCWFLAADFDKASWTDDVAAFTATCRAHGLPTAVERSRSGNGAHVWFFLSAPMAASAARQMGCYLITETMSRRHQLSMGSYDRLFPNQDTLPRGGFGNLIALPLQHGPRQMGNTVFVDDHFVPHADQWHFLSMHPCIEPATVETVAHEARRKGLVLGVRLTDTSDSESSEPWTRRPSGQPPVRFSAPLPREVRAVLAQRLFVTKGGLAPTHLNQIKRLAAFQNPEFYRKQSLRLSTALTPRVVACAEDLLAHVALPRGCRPELEQILREHGSALLVDDQRCEGKPINVAFEGRLTAVQKKAARALRREDIGVLVAPPGVGKTVIGTYLIAARSRNTLVLVHRQPLLDQWIAQLSMFLGTAPKAIGQIGAGKHAATGWIDVAMIQTLVRSGRVDDLVATYGHVIVDECHHIPAVSFERVLGEVKARFVTGLTATPHRRDGLHPIIEMQLGPVRFAVDARSQAARRPFEHRLIIRETAFGRDHRVSDERIQPLYAQLATDEPRNRLILDDVRSALAAGRSPILLTERKDHLELLAADLQNAARHVIVLRGGMTLTERRGAAATLGSIPDGESRLLIATGRYIGEGFDDGRLDTLFLAMPVSWKGTLVQYAGRLHRLHPGKTEVRIYDYVDRNVPMLARMFEKRLRGYRAIGYARDAGIPSTRLLDDGLQGYDVPEVSDESATEGMTLPLVEIRDLKR